MPFSNLWIDHFVMKIEKVAYILTNIVNVKKLDVWEENGIKVAVGTIIKI